MYVYISFNFAFHFQTFAINRHYFYVIIERCKCICISSIDNWLYTNFKSMSCDLLLCWLACLIIAKLSDN